jgi:hypothetical protein
MCDQIPDENNIELNIVKEFEESVIIQFRFPSAIAGREYDHYLLTRGLKHFQE